MDGSRRKPGYTLMELATVMVVVAIVAIAVGGPTLAFMSATRSRFAATRIGADLAYVQRLAMNARRRTWVVFDVLNNRYTLYAENPTNPGKANRQLLANPLTGDTGATQLGTGEFGTAALASVSINATAELEFDSLGKPYDANSAELTANGTISLNNSVVLTIRPVSGLVEQN
ncbi:MAG: prepilin-type N-terminal cleavage/methylation domain-containing protein [Phycisphaerae bacterium]